MPGLLESDYISHWLNERLAQEGPARGGTRGLNSHIASEPYKHGEHMWSYSHLARTAHVV